MREIGRLREFAFRTVGEALSRRDLDEYDAWYMHLILWDPDDLEIAGLIVTVTVGRSFQVGRDGLYTNSFYRFEESIKSIFEEGLELGRSFVQPRYWGKRSLEYLWVGIGALLRNHPHYRYLFGSVSISNALPKDAQAALVQFYSAHFPPVKPLATANLPYQSTQESTTPTFSGSNWQKSFHNSKRTWRICLLPTMYKQYSELCEKGGVQFLTFGMTRL